MARGATGRRGPNDLAPGSSRFGLLISWDRLVRQSGSSAAVPSYLGLAIDEPHAAGLDSTVLWFLDLPSGLH